MMIRDEMISRLPDHLPAIAVYPPDPKGFAANVDACMEHIEAFSAEMGCQLGDLEIRPFGAGAVAVVQFRGGVQ